MSAESNLFFEDTVFVCDRTTQEEVFTEIANKLSLKNYVAPAFLENIIEREKGYPTGMDMSVVDPELPSFAVPHTVVEFVHTRRRQADDPRRVALHDRPLADLLRLVPVHDSQRRQGGPGGHPRQDHGLR